MENIEVVHCLENCTVYEKTLTAKIQFRTKEEVDRFVFLWKELEQETDEKPNDLTYKFLDHLENDMGDYLWA